MFLALEYGVEENKPLAVSRLINKGNLYSGQRYINTMKTTLIFTRKEREAREAVN